jgi:ketosteroid isomerase-like protein
MADRDAFLDWVTNELTPAERQLHDGNAAGRRALWSRREPVSVFGAWRNAIGQVEVDALFTLLEQSFSTCTDFRMEVLSASVVGDMAYTACLEHTSVSVNGEPRSYVLRVTQVYRHEDGDWRVAHRHGDTVAD